VKDFHDLIFSRKRAQVTASKSVCQPFAVKRKQSCEAAVEINNFDDGKGGGEAIKQKAEPKPCL
jgi:CHASE3 domain sensor protein